MKKLLGSLFGRFVPVWGQIRAARDWLTLLAVAAAAAFLYWKFATIRADRDELQAFARVACATAGAEFDAQPASVGEDGRATKAHKRGALCMGRIGHLAAFERDTLSSSNAALAGALRDHNRKSEADAAAAARDFAAAAEAAQKMEHADNAISENDRVGRDWFDALNGLAGLREPKR